MLLLSPPPPAAPNAVDSLVSIQTVCMAASHIWTIQAVFSLGHSYGDGRKSWVRRRRFQVLRDVTPGRYGQYATGLGDVGFESWQEQDNFLFSQKFRPASLLFNWHWGSFPGVNGRGAKVTTHLSLPPKLRMSGAILLHPLYASCLV